MKKNPSAFRSLQPESQGWTFLECVATGDLKSALRTELLCSSILKGKAKWFSLTEMALVVTTSNAILNLVLFCDMNGKSVNISYRYYCKRAKSLRDQNVALTHIYFNSILE